jgi:hypothetical protein
LSVRQGLQAAQEIEPASDTRLVSQGGAARNRNSLHEEEWPPVSTSDYVSEPQPYETAAKEEQSSMLARERRDQPRSMNGETREGGDHEAQETQSQVAGSDAHGRGRRGRSRSKAGRREGKDFEGQERQSEGGFSSASARAGAPAEAFGSFIYGVPGHWDDDILEEKLWGAVSKAVTGFDSFPSKVFSRFKARANSGRIRGDARPTYAFADFSTKLAKECFDDGACR